jgi:hypothetical protein
LPDRPVCPNWIVGDEVQQDVGVDQNHISSRRASGP